MRRVNFQIVIILILIIALIGVTLFFMNFITLTKSAADSSTNTNLDTKAGIDASSQINEPINEAPAVNQNGVVLLFQTVDLDKANEKHKTISGRVQNKGTTVASSVIVNAKIYDSNNTLIATPSTRPLYNDLKPEQISWFYIDVYEYFSNYTLSIDWKNGN